MPRFNAVIAAFGAFFSAKSPMLPKPSRVESRGIASVSWGWETWDRFSGYFLIYIHHPRITRKSLPCSQSLPYVDAALALRLRRDDQGLNFFGSLPALYVCSNSSPVVTLVWGG